MPEEKMCPIHGEKLWWHEGRDGREGWFSHKTADPKYPKGYCNGKPPPQAKPKEVQGPNMYQIRTEIAKMCSNEGMGVDWALVQKVEAYVVGGIIPTGVDPFPPEAV